MMRWITLGSATDFPSGAPTCVDAGGESLVVCHVARDAPGGGGFRVVRNQCPHAGLPIGDGDLRGRVLTCPYHGYPYDVKTGRHVLYPHEEPPLRTYVCRIHEGMLQVQMESNPPHPEETPGRDPSPAAPDEVTGDVDHDGQPDVEDPETPTGYPDQKGGDAGTVEDGPVEPEGESK